MPQHDPYLAASLRVQTGLLLGYAALVLGASLYPFDFEPARLLAAAHAGFGALRDWQPPSRRDLYVNLLAYVPLGLLAGLALRARIPSVPLRWLAATLLGAALSLLVEIAQHATHVRVPSLADWWLNTLSSAAGATLALLLALLPARPLAARLRRLQVNPALLLLVVLWIVAHTAPFLPRLRPGRIESALAASLALRPQVAGVAGFFAAWLILSAALRTLVRRESFWSLFLSVAAGSLATRLLFVGQRLTPDECLGLLLALPLILRLRSRGHAAAQTPLFAAVCLALLAIGTAPFAFTGPFGEFSLRPYPVLLGAAPDPFDLGTLERLFVGFGAVWLAAGSAAGLGAGTLVLLLVTLVGEFAQLWMPQRIADTSELCTLLAGMLLVGALRRFEGRRAAWV